MSCFLHATLLALALLAEFYGRVLSPDADWCGGVARSKDKTLAKRGGVHRSRLRSATRSKPCEIESS